MTPRSKKALAARVATVYVTYWLTRDSDPVTGVPADYVDVWWSRPTRYAVGDRGGFWLDRFSGLSERQACWSIDAARVTGQCPDDGMQCIRVGPEAGSRDALATVKGGEA